MKKINLLSSKTIEQLDGQEYNIRDRDDLIVLLVGKVNELIDTVAELNDKQFTSANIAKAHMQMSKKGGATTKKKHDHAYWVALGKKGAETRKLNKPKRLKELENKETI